MLRQLKDLFDAIAGPAQGAGTQPAHTGHQLHLATAVLLVEVMRADPQLGAQERDAVIAGLRSRFALADDELDVLFDLAHDTARTANDFFRFTNTLNERFSHDEKIRMVESMWSVAFADGHLDVHENATISRVAGLLHVTHGEYIAAKLRAKGQ
jgi:uncharacterized tellurite resistance protein B-like protein